MDTMVRLTVALFVALTLALGFSTATLAQDIDCGEITGDEADQILAADPSDPNGLDGDNDGFPCENNPRSGGAAAPAAPAPAAPVAEAPAAPAAPAAAPAAPA
nr:excalibur calcium-binding domain-containing protein [Chloroflexota bacterium]